MDKSKVPHYLLAHLVDTAAFQTISIVFFR